MKNPFHNSCVCLLLLFGAAALLTACGTSREKAVHRAVTAERAQERTQQRRLRIPLEPTHLRQDYAHPLFTVRQSFMWGPFENEWRLTIVDHTAEYAGFHMRLPVLIPRQREGMVLLFELWPPDAADTLALGLIDRRLDDPGHYAALPIRPYQFPRRDEAHFQTYSIPLNAFEADHVRRSRDGSFEVLSHSPDWSNIIGIHLLRLSTNATPSRRVIIRNLQFAPYTWVHELRAGGQP